MVKGTTTLFKFHRSILPHQSASTHYRIHSSIVTRTQYWLANKNVDQAATNFGPFSAVANGFFNVGVSPPAAPQFTQLPVVPGVMVVEHRNREAPLPEVFLFAVAAAAAPEPEQDRVSPNLVFVIARLGNDVRGIETSWERGSQSSGSIPGVDPCTGLDWARAGLRWIGGNLKSRRILYLRSCIRWWL